MKQSKFVQKNESALTVYFIIKKFNPKINKQNKKNEFYLNRKLKIALELTSKKLKTMSNLLSLTVYFGVKSTIQKMKMKMKIKTKLKNTRNVIQMKN